MIMKIKYHARRFKKIKNKLNYGIWNVLNGGDNNVVDTGFRYHAGVMKTYEQAKTGLSGNYSKRILEADGKATRPLAIWNNKIFLYI